jgi:hypothetical protein
VEAAPRWSAHAAQQRSHTSLLHGNAWQGLAFGGFTIPTDLYADCIDPLEAYSLHARLSVRIAASIHRCCLLARTSRPGSLLELG